MGGGEGMKGEAWIALCTQSVLHGRHVKHQGHDMEHGAVTTQ